LYNAGNELNQTTGIYETYFRGYDPTLGRFIQVDPLATISSSLNPYHYAYNNPVNLNDPLGLEASITWEDINRIIDYLRKNGGGTWSSSAWSESGGSDGGGDSCPGCTVFGKNESYEISSSSNGGGGTLFVTSSTAEVSQDGNTIRGYTTVSIIDIGEGTAQQGEVTDFTNSNWALEVGGGVFGAMEGATVGQGYWLGKNGKYYPERWGGNQYTGSRAGAFKAANMYKWAGRGTVAVTSVIGGIQTYNGYQMDGGEFGYNAQSAAAQTIGGIGGGVGGAVLGAEIGAGIGVWFGGVGAVPGAIIGGFVGGIIGGWGGSSLGEGAVNLYHGR
jgi:RHS repeat-associated protein